MLRFPMAQTIILKIPKYRSRLTKSPELTKRLLILGADFQDFLVVSSDLQFFFLFGCQQHLEPIIEFKAKKRTMAVPDSYSKE